MRGYYDRRLPALSDVSNISKRIARLRDWTDAQLDLLKTYLKVERDDRPEQKRMVPVKKGRK